MKYLTFGASKDMLRMVTDNGLDASDSRVMTRTNEATQMILGMRDPQTNQPVIPVNGMTFALIQVTNSFFDLPPSMESAIHVEQNETDGHLTAINGQTDVTQGFYNILNPFTYLDPTMAYDNPFVDYGLNPSLTDSTQLVRRYYYPGFVDGRILVIGPKAYLPITQDSDYLIVQNVPALKRMIQSVELTENNQIDEGQKLYDQSRDMIIGEIKKYNTDPRFVMQRKANYEADITTFQAGSLGWMRGRIALEVPGALMVGKNDITRIINRAQLRMMEAGTFKGCLEQFNATITDGHVYFPSRIEACLGANLNGRPIDIRTMFYKYNEAGPGEVASSCDVRLEDEGETFFPNAGVYRRTYRARVGTDGSELVCVCKLRWEDKLKPEEQLVIRNLEANRLMAKAILLEEQDQWGPAGEAQEKVLGDGHFGRPMGVLHKELREYLRGTRIAWSAANAIGVGDLGVIM